MTAGRDTDDCVDPALDEVLQAVGSWRRRLVVYHLIDREENHSSFEEVASVIADRGDGEADRDKVDALLYHGALPSLQAAGIVEYDERSGAIRYVPDAIPVPLVEALHAVEHQS